ncbi:MAG: DeoR/GlpR family DNA-binding transcription regulator [Verrucomicrobiia bacterium]
MRVPAHLVEARRRKLGWMLQQEGYLPVAEVCRRLHISPATARRDLVALAGQKQVTRTYGGAMVDYNLRFPSFQQRQKRDAAGKAKVAEAAYRSLTPGELLFFDAGTTVYAVAQRIREHPIGPLTVVTSSLPVADLLAPLETVRVHLLGGQLLPRQSVLLGEGALREVPHWNFDRAILSVQGFDAEGLWNTTADVVAIQKAVMARSRRVVVCADASKLGQQGPSLLCGWREKFRLLTDAPQAALEAAGIPLTAGHYWGA